MTRKKKGPDAGGGTSGYSGARYRSSSRRAPILETRHRIVQHAERRRAQRVWFPEMVDRLRSQWQDGLSIDALLALRAELDGMLHHIRALRNIRTAVITCRVCGATGPEPEPHVSVRATIAALVRFGIASKDVARVLERDWAACRRQNDLDLFGHALDPQRPGASRCMHPGAPDDSDAK
jgi:hypothetical protein